LSQRQVGQACMLAREAPGRLAVPGQINDRQLFTHGLATPTMSLSCLYDRSMRLLSEAEIKLLSQPWRRARDRACARVRRSAPDRRCSPENPAARNLNSSTSL